MNRPLAAFLLAVITLGFFLLSPVYGADSAGRKAFRAKGCASCHPTARPKGAISRAAFLAQKGPNLWYAGSKFQEGFLSRWLADPQSIRPLAYNSLTKKNEADHPRLGSSEAEAVASWLMTLRADDLVRPVGVRPGVNVRGRIVFIKKFACYGCHLVKVRGTLAGGLSGPSFEGVKNRLNPEWIYAFLTNQRAFNPLGRMPVYEGLASASKMRALTAYTAGLE